MTKKTTEKKPLTIRVGGWIFYCDHAYPGQEKLARYQAKVISKALSTDAAYEAARTIRATLKEPTR